MTKTTRARYTLEFKQEAVRLVAAGQSIAAAARTLGVVDQGVPLFSVPKVTLRTRPESQHWRGSARAGRGKCLSGLGFLLVS